MTKWYRCDRIIITFCDTVTMTFVPICDTCDTVTIAEILSQRLCHFGVPEHVPLRRAYLGPQVGYSSAQSNRSYRT
jgi:hypothetical protein